MAPFFKGTLSLDSEMALSDELPGLICVLDVFLQAASISEQWQGFHLHLWPWKGERDMAGTLHLRSLKELRRVVGVFLEAETRHCEIKINRQGMFAIQIPVPARRAEGAGRRGVWRKSNGICCRHLSPSTGGFVCDICFLILCLVLYRKLGLMVVTILCKEKLKHSLIQRVRFWKPHEASFEVPEGISRRGE